MGTPAPENEWMTTEELAAWLQVSVPTIYTWRGVDEAPPAYKLGRHLRWRRTEVEEWLQHKRTA